MKRFIKYIFAFVVVITVPIWIVPYYIYDAVRNTYDTGVIEFYKRSAGKE